MAAAFWTDCGNQIALASSAAKTMRALTPSDPHVAAHADVAAERAQHRPGEQKVPGKARYEGGIVAQRDEADVGFEAHNQRLVADNEQREGDRGGDQARHYALDHERPAHKPLGGADELHDLDLLAPVIHGG